MEQISIFEEKTIVRLQPSDYLYNSIVKRYGKYYWKQELKKKWPLGSRFEDYNEPSYSQICSECFKRGLLYKTKEDRSLCTLCLMGLYEKCTDIKGAE